MSVGAPTSTAEAPGATEPNGEQPPGRRRIRLAGGVAALIGAAALVAVIGPFGDSSGAEGDSDGEGAPSLARVERGRLASQVYQSGSLDYAAQADGSPYSVVNQAAGAYTALPGTGDEIGCGEVLYRVADEPVALLCGRTPAYRSLSEGMDGPDVRQLNRNLVSLGYAGRDELDPTSDYFGAETASALERLQDELGLEQTGSLEPEQAVFLPGPLRITRVTATLGTMAQPGAPVAQATSTRRRVEVDLDASQAAVVEIGDRARVTLPDNETTPGIVTDVGTVAGGGGSGSDSGSEEDSASATIPVYVRLEDADDVAAIDQAPVEVEITTERVKDALSVPVTALLARAGGGYAVETVGAGGERELVSVNLGAFDQANGLVQVSGADLEAGQQVVVPST
ncbi:MAG: peptidoglycan-binding protein [Solirubrobacterales bacterium]|nr:peptidoglycan-binding protein [Solirubrobacterales bacterium]